MPSFFHSENPFHLESGASIRDLRLAYTTYGQLNESKDNVVWVFHALTANSDPADWWPGLVGDGKLFSADACFIICVNIPGSCYGSTGPLDLNPETGEPYFHQFPLFTTRDMIRAYQLLRVHLGIQKIKLGIGGSMGGQQLLEWAVEEPALFENIIALATNAQHSAWGIAFNASQRMAIENDPAWKEKSPEAGLNGMKTARSIALLSYRNYHTYVQAQSENLTEKTDHYKAESYQRYQGEKLAKRFNAFSYYFLSKSMDAHHTGRKRGGVSKALSQITARALVIGIESDILFPLEEQQALAAQIPGAMYRQIHSTYGHDGFLLENEQIEAAIRAFLPAAFFKQEQNLITK